MKDWLKAIGGWIISYALRFIVGFALLVLLLFLLDWMGVL